LFPLLPFVSSLIVILDPAAAGEGSLIISERPERRGFSRAEMVRDPSAALRCAQDDNIH
jgi:hypothetical protein